MISGGFDWIQSLMPSETVTVEPKIGTDRYNRDIYGSPILFQAYVVRKPEQVRTMAGEERMSGVQISLGPTTLDIKPDDRITLADGSRPRMLSVSTAPLDDDRNYVVIYA